MNQKKKALIAGSVLILVLGLWLLNRGDSRKGDVTDAQALAEMGDIKDEKFNEITFAQSNRIQPLIKEPIIKKIDQPKATDTASIKEKKRAIIEKIEVLEGHLEKCRSQVEGLIKEKDVQELESTVWDIEDRKIGTSEMRVGLEEDIKEKVSSLTSIDWHMEEVSEVNKMLMDESLAASDSEWALKMGTKLRPCGIYNTHRLMGLWIELAPKKSTGSKTMVEKQVVTFVKDMLQHATGAAGMAMQVELLAGLSEKGYFDAQMREQVGYMEKRLNDELDSKYDGVDGNSKELIQTIMKDYRDNESTRQEMLELLRQYFPN